MGSTALLFLQVTVILSTLLAAGCAVACWHLASRFTQLQRWARKRVMTETSDAKLAGVLADQAELFSTLGKLTTTVKRLSSRHGMQDLRERHSSPAGPPPLGDKKAAREFFLAGKTPAQLHLIHKAGAEAPAPPTEESN